MSFFKKYNGSTNARHMRIERATWVCIYGGLLALVLGSFVERQAGNPIALYAAGSAAVLAGVVMIYLRSRMGKDK